jgi:hypothetical protein
MAVTVMARDPTTLLNVAEMVTLPLATAVARPEPFTVAMLVELDAQATCEVRLRVLASL